MQFNYLRMFWLQTLDFEFKWIEIENSKVELISPLKVCEVVCVYAYMRFMGGGLLPPWWVLQPPQNTGPLVKKKKAPTLFFPLLSLMSTSWLLPDFTKKWSWMDTINQGTLVCHVDDTVKSRSILTPCVWQLDHNLVAQLGYFLLTWELGIVLRAFALF